MPDRSGRGERTDGDGGGLPGEASSGASLLARRYGRRRVVGGGLALAAVGLGLLAGPRGAPRVWAQAKDGDTGAWQPTGLHEAARELFTPTSGAFFARTREAL